MVSSGSSEAPDVLKLQLNVKAFEGVDAVSSNADAIAATAIPLNKYPEKCPKCVMRDFLVRDIMVQLSEKSNLARRL